jgi:AAA15 family ATPase/GTPase
MLKSLKIKNFRCFEEFDLPQLGRVNLLVGKNNSGKTSILEALHILNSPGSCKPFFDIIDCRGEHSWNENNSNEEIFDVNHLFHGHQSDKNSCFEFSGIDAHMKNIKFFFNSKSDISQEQLFLTSAPTDGRKRSIEFVNPSSNQSSEIIFSLKWEGLNDTVSVLYIPINTPRHNIHNNTTELKSSQLIHLASSSMNTVIGQFNQIVLTPQEDILYESLRTIEPGIERIAPVAIHRHQIYGNGGFVVLINKQRVPIGSMGYGIWRMLEITLAMVNIPGGTLLIDEIDTGLHFSVMIDLWKLICKTAEKLDIQVFATTHNSDCWKSLAEVANSDDIASEDITIHRIERGKKESIVFNEQEMAIAAERDIEVR